MKTKVQTIQKSANLVKIVNENNENAGSDDHANQKGQLIKMDSLMKRFG